MLTKIKLDEMEHYQIAANGIEPAGLERIAELLQESGIPADVMENVEPVWVTKRGTYPKRLAKALRRRGYAATPALMGAIGQAAADNTSRTEEYWFQIDSQYTDDESGFPYDAGEHGDDESCYHPGGQHDHAPYDIEKSGGMLLRTFRPAPGGYYFEYTPGKPFEFFGGIARCFLVPCTYSAGGEEYEGLVMINGYCQPGYDHDLLHLARLIATAEGLSYRKVAVRDVLDQIYVNNDSGYLLGEWENIHNIQSVDIRVENAEYSPSRGKSACDACGQGYEEEDLTVIGDDLICPTCLQAGYTRCDRCGEWAHYECITAVSGEQWCRHCADAYAVACALCGARHPRVYAFRVGREYWCETCYDKYAVECKVCGEYHARDATYEVGGRALCWYCARHTCRACGEIVDVPVRIDGQSYCHRCAPV
jgi:formylmethanofuran dehydrogenase subunit E